MSVHASYDLSTVHDSFMVSFLCFQQREMGFSLIFWIKRVRWVWFSYSFL